MLHELPEHDCGRGALKKILYRDVSIMNESTCIHQDAPASSEERRMSEHRADIPQQTLEALARSFFRESSSYGFRRIDYVRFVNLLLDMAIRKKNANIMAPCSKKSEKLDIFGCSDYSSKPIDLPIIGNCVCVRALDADQDYKFFMKWLDDKYSRHFLLSCTTATTQTYENFSENKSNIIGVVTLHDGTPIGSVAFLYHDALQRKAELRKLIGDPSMRGKGFAKEATWLWIQYGTTTLRLKKIYLTTLDTNIRNIRLNEELGFKMEGILRNEIFLDGKHRDVLRMGLCNE